MATLNIPYQSLSYDFPDEGVPFYSTNGNPETPVAVRSGNTVYQISTEAFKAMGGNVNSLQRWNLADGELQQAIQATTKQPLRIQQTQGSAFSPLIKQAPAAPEVFTQNVAPQNPNGIQVTNASGTTVNQSPTTQEALLSAGATQQQATALASAAQQNVVTPQTATPTAPVGMATAYTPQQLEAAQVSTAPTGPVQQINLPQPTQAPSQAPQQTQALQSAVAPLPTEPTAQQLQTRLAESGLNASQQSGVTSGAGYTGETANPTAFVHPAPFAQTDPSRVINQTTGQTAASAALPQPTAPQPSQVSSMMDQANSLKGSLDSLQSKGYTDAAQVPKGVDISQVPNYSGTPQNSASVSTPTSSGAPGGFNSMAGASNTSGLSGAESALRSSLTPSTQENTLQGQDDAFAAQLRTFDQKQAQLDAANGRMMLDAQGQPIAKGFITGQQAALQSAADQAKVGFAADRQGITNDRQTVQQQLARAQAQRQSSIDVSKFELERQDKLADSAKTQAETLRKEQVELEKEKRAATAKANEPYTLSEGQKRFDADGKLISSVAKTYAPGTTGGSGSGVTTSKGTYVAGQNATVDAWANRIQNGSAKITDIPAKDASLRNKVTVALDAMGNSTDGKPTTTELGRAALTTAQQLLQKFNDGIGTMAVPVGSQRNVGGAIAGMISGTGAKNFTTDFNALKSQLSLEGVKYLKGQGAVSDAERALLAQAVTKLNLKQSDVEFKKTLNEVIAKLKGVSGTTPPPSSSSSPDKMQLPNGTIVTKQADGTYK